MSRHIAADAHSDSIQTSFRMTFVMRTRACRPECAYKLAFVALMLQAVVGGLLCFAGVDGLMDAARTRQALGWPIVEAKLDRCEVSIEPGRRGAYWEVFAVWRYGEGLHRHYDERWRAAHAPREEQVGAGEAAAARARYCGAPGLAQLRVSPTDPRLALRNDLVVHTSGWSFVFPALLLMGGVLCLVWVGWNIVDQAKWRRRESALLAMTQTRPQKGR